MGFRSTLTGCPEILARSAVLTLKNRTGKEYVTPCIKLPKRVKDEIRYIGFELGTATFGSRED